MKKGRFGALAARLAPTASTGLRIEGPEPPRVSERSEVTYWRTTTGIEVDIVIERDGALLAAVVKTTSRPRPHDARGLRAFLNEHPDTARGGPLLHSGREVFWMHQHLLAVPWWLVL